MCMCMCVYAQLCCRLDVKNYVETVNERERETENIEEFCNSVPLLNTHVNCC